MTDRIAQAVITDKVPKKEWKNLNKRLDEAASQRGKIAHYGLDFEIKITGQGLNDFERRPAKLSQSRHNAIAKLKGESVAQRYLTIEELQTFVDNFDKLSTDLHEFTMNVSGPLPQESGLLSTLGLLQTRNR
jgi:hypothetical protein